MKEHLTISILMPVPLDGSHLCALDILLGVDVETYVVSSFTCQVFHQRLPYELTLFTGELGIEELFVDAGDEGAHTVRGKEEDAVVVLEGSEEACWGGGGLSEPPRP